jgi:hypothetical protein
LALSDESLNLLFCGVYPQFKSAFPSASSFLLDSIPVFSLVFEADMGVG